MKGFLILVTMLLIFSCNSNTVEKPSNLIEEDEMIAILYDISLLEAVKNQNISGGITVKYANEFIFRKYKIDSIQFVKSNTYYASDIEEYKKMFEKVKTRLNAEIQKNETTGSIPVRICRFGGFKHEVQHGITIEAHSPR